MSKDKILPLIFSFSILLNVALFFVLLNNNGTMQGQQNSVSLQKKYPLLARRALVENPNDLLVNFLSLRSKLQEQVKPYDTDFAFYFEYLPTGTSIGVNSTEEFYAASLFKVPVIMAYYHRLERTGETRDKVLTIQKDDIDKDFGDLWKRGVGAKVKASEAVRLTLTESDNTAAKMIARQIDDQDFQAVYQSLDLNLQTGTGGVITSTRNYSTVIKALYFAAVVNIADSNEILTYLTQSKFNDKLVAGIGDRLTIAHKIGDYRDAQNEKAYYDCGIVYLPKRPFVLCMSSVGDEQTARDRMSKLSKTIYDYVTSVK